MKTILRVVGPVALGLAAMASAAGPNGAASLDADWIKAMKANDLNAVLACYAADAVVWGPDESEASGAKAIHDSYADFLSKYSVKDAATSDTHYSTVGDKSVGWGHFSLTVVPKSGGDPATMKGRFSEIAEKKGGRWVYTVDHASLEPAPAAKP